jgi:hypothetical protein
MGLSVANISPCPGGVAARDLALALGQHDQAHSTTSSHAVARQVEVVVGVQPGLAEDGASAGAAAPR